MTPIEAIIPMVKTTIAASVKCNTYRGHIGWRSCDNIWMDMHDCLEMCGYMTALEAATYILVSGVKLASHADSSSGMLTDVIMCTYELIDKCTKEIEKQDKQMRDQALIDIFQEALRKSKNITSDPFQVLSMSQDDLKKLSEIEKCIKLISGMIEKIR